MGNVAIDGWRRMDALVLDHGDDGVLHMICDRVSDDMSLTDVSRAEGVPYSVLWKWLSGKDERMAAYRDALEARADAEAHRMLEIADTARVEDVVVGKLRVDTRKWLSERWGKRTYGKEEGGGAGGITVLIDRGLEAKVEGGVLKISAEQKQGDQFIEGEVVGGNQATI